MGGWEKSQDYGGGKDTVWTILGTAVAHIVAIALIFYILIR